VLKNRFEQTSATSGTCHEDRKQECVGGFARVYTAVNQLVEERPNAIFLNAGDHFQGTLWYNVHRWNATALFMNMLPHDAMVKKKSHLQLRYDTFKLDFTALTVIRYLSDSSLSRIEEESEFDESDVRAITRKR